jgi:putative endonuclease
MYTLYILLCSDNTLYTGITNNLDKRLADHNSGKGAKYTRGRRPVKVVYTETFSDKSSAMKRETEIKKLKKSDKLKMISD